MCRLLQKALYRPLSLANSDAIKPCCKTSLLFVFVFGQKGILRSRYHSASHCLTCPLLMFVPCPRPPFRFIMVPLVGRETRVWSQICHRPLLWPPVVFDMCAPTEVSFPLHTHLLLLPGSTRHSRICDSQGRLGWECIHRTEEEREACAARGNVPAWWASSCCPRPSSAWSPTYCSSFQTGNKWKTMMTSPCRSGSWGGSSEGVSL